MNNRAKLDFIVDLHQRNSAYLGFIPKPSLEKYVNNDQVFLEYEGGLPSGYCVIGSGKGKTLKIYQHCVEAELRRLEHGKELFKRIEFEAQKRGYENIHLRCRENLESNKFWKALGFEFLFLENKITQRTKKGINHWNFKIVEPRQYSIFGI
jgi:ribosomal protein S18 acetylase RimI-like enzyme|tara:strand:- start:1732 stop:2187 length:456 start_codon:yes stop_codon:yes gene_type:complete